MQVKLVSLQINFFKIILRLLQISIFAIRSSYENLNSIHTRTHAVQPTHVMLQLNYKVCCPHLLATHLMWRATPTHSEADNQQDRSKNDQNNQKSN